MDVGRPKSPQQRETWVNGKQARVDQPFEPPSDLEHSNDGRHKPGAPADAGDRIGEMVGEYRIVAMLGHGGMGTVYEAVHPAIGRRVAIKILHRHLCEDSRSVARFVHEAKAVNRIGHPNIVDVFGLGTTFEGQAYLVMELLVGSSLAGWLAGANVPRLDVATMCDVLEEVASALEAAHAAGIVHRDLKPENIFISRTRGGQIAVKLLDFGLAKLRASDADAETMMPCTATGMFVGTPLYIAPEQVCGLPVTGATDVYALGVVAFELLTGAPPFVADDVMELVTHHVKTPAPQPSSFDPTLPALADVLCTQMLDKAPERRPALAQVRAMLAQLRAAEPRAPGQLEQPLFVPLGPDDVTIAAPRFELSPEELGLDVSAAPVDSKVIVSPPVDVPATYAIVQPVIQPVIQPLPADFPAPQAVVRATTAVMPAEPSRVLWLALAIGAGAVLAFVLWLFVHVVTH